MFGKIFGRGRRDESARSDEPLIAVPIPPLVTVLLALEKEKAAPLTEEEVLRARDGAVCMAMPASTAHELAAKRGYRDLNPENVWQEWQAFLKS